MQWPVIAIGTMPDGTLMFAAVDGRHPERSIGMTRPEFGELLRGYGMIDAMALDSGGSVTLVSRAPGNERDHRAQRAVRLRCQSATSPTRCSSTAPRRSGTIVTAPRPHVEPDHRSARTPMIAAAAGELAPPAPFPLVVAQWSAPEDVAPGIRRADYHLTTSAGPLVVHVRGDRHARSDRAAWGRSSRATT